MKRLRNFTIGFFLVALCTTNTLFAQTGQEIHTVREFDEDFKERYSDNRYNYEGEEVVKNSRSGNGNYSDFRTEDNPDLEEQNNETQLESDSSIQIPFLNWILIFALVGAVLYLGYILLNEGGHGIFSSNRNRSIQDEEELTVENIGQIDIRSLIQKAEQAGNYRLAIRYYYILVLKTLSLNNFIKLEDDKTNEEYYTEIKSQPFSQGFSYTSYLYNYIWYGEFPINQLQYNKAKTNFDNLIKKVA